MLSFDDDFHPARIAEGARARPTRSSAGRRRFPEALPRRRRSRTSTSTSEATPAGFHRVRVEDKRVINGQADVNQLVPFKYTWAWDKYLAGCANHWMPQEINMQRDIELWKNPQRPDRRRAADRQAQPGLLRHRRQPRRQQHRARHLPAHHRARVPAVPAAPGLRGGDPHACVPVHRGEPRPGRSGDLQRVSRGQVDPRQGRVPDPVHRDADRSDVQDRHAGGRPAAPEEPDRLRLHHGRPVLLRRLRADPRNGPAEQDDGRRPSSTSTSCATSRCTATSASTSSTRSSSRIRICGRREFSAEIPS